MNNMNLQQLKEYLKCVFELEGQLYKHQKLVEGYSQKRHSNMPQEPIKHLPNNSSSPNFKYAPTFMEYVRSDSSAGWIYFLGVIVASICIFMIGFPLSMASDFGWQPQYISMELWGLMLLLIPFFCFYSIKKKVDTASNEIEKQNQAERTKYDNALKAHNADIANAEKAYFNKMQQFYQDRANYNRETTYQLAKFDEIKNTLQSSLTKLYSQNIIYAKYRNLVAISTIYEYFESGRCTELEGPNGAYNMYEGELRSNIIICSLSQIISDLGQIKNGQYALYEQINRSNLEVTKMLDNIYNAQMLTAYYAEAAAKAASADRYAIGVIY